MLVALPTGPRGRALALSVTVLLVLVLWVGVATPLIDLYDDRAIRLAQRMQMAEHMKELAAQLPALESQAKASSAGGPPPVVALSGASDAVAQASLQNMMRDMASQSGASLSSIENVDGESEADGYRRVGIRLALSASWSSLVDLLRSIRQAHLPMFVDDLEIHAPPLIAANASPTLTTAFTVYAFRAPAQAEAKP